MLIDIEPQGRFGRYLHRALEQNNTSVRDLSGRIESTYEHIRKLIKGLAFPSKYMLDNLAKELKGFDRAEALLLVEQDKAQKKFKNFHVMTGQNPELDPIEKEWAYLSDEQKRNVITIVHAFAEQTRMQSPGYKTEQQPGGGQGDHSDSNH